MGGGTFNGVNRAVMSALLFALVVGAIWLLLAKLPSHDSPEFPDQRDGD
jgi:hypothetical protein